MSLATITLIGRLTKDPDTSHFADKNLVRLRMAWSQGKDKPGYINVTCFSKAADIAQTYLRKGTQCGITGRLEWREYDGDDGKKVQAYGIICEKITLLGKSNDDDEDKRVVEAASTQAALDEDIPF